MRKRPPGGAPGAAATLMNSPSPVTRTQEEWFVLRWAGVVLSSICIAASCAALLKLLWKRHRRQQSKGEADGRFIRLVETVLASILLLDMISNIATFSYSCLHQGAAVFRKGQMEAPTKLGMVNYFHIREALGATVLYYHVVLGQILKDWIVKKFSVARLERRYRIEVLLLFGALGATMLFIVMEVLRLYLGMTGVLISVVLYDGVVMPVAIVYMTWIFFSIARALQERFARLRSRILLMVSLCQFIGVGATLMDVLIWLNLWVDESPALRLWSSLIGLVTWRIVGLVDAVVLGGLCECSVLTSRSSGSSRRGGQSSSSFPSSVDDRLLPDDVEAAYADKGATGGAAASTATVSSGRQEDVHIFATTWNMGSLKSLGSRPQKSIERWIPRKGYDMYAVAFQECVNLTEMREEINIYLGPGFVMSVIEINDATVLQGSIALVLYYRESDVASGALFVYEGSQNTLRTGVDLGIARAGNKGMCGLSVRYHDATLAFIAAHFHSDSHGQTRIEERYKDARDMVRGLSLGWDMDIDAHLQHHHTFLLGDLNFRSDGSPKEVMALMVKSATQEKASARWAGAEDWRTKSYQAAIMMKGGSSSTPGHSLPPHGMGAASSSSSLRGLSGVFGGAVAEEEDEDVDDDYAESMVTPTTSPTNAIPGASGRGKQDGASHNHRLHHDDDDPWWWLIEYDQLTSAVREEQALEGFREGHIRFPPSYRYRRHGEGPGDFTNLARLSAALSWKASKSTSGKVSYRTPSYCDRVLVHSLPDKKPAIKFLGYDMCDAMRGSDHLPVSAALALQVDKTVHGFTRVQLDRDGGSSSSHRALAANVHAQSSSWEGSGTTSTTTTNNNNPSLPRLLAEDSATTDDLSSPFVAVVTIDIRNITYDFLLDEDEAPGSAAAEVGDITLVYPLLSEDPLAFRRKAMLVDNIFPSLGPPASVVTAVAGGSTSRRTKSRCVPVFSYRTSSSSSSTSSGAPAEAASSLSASADPPEYISGESGGSGGGGVVGDAATTHPPKQHSKKARSTHDATDEELGMLLRWVKRVNWAEDRGRGRSTACFERPFKTQVLAHTLFSEHAALTLMDLKHSKRTLGHAVFPIFPTVTGQAREMTVPLTLGATPAGSITFEIKVDRHRPHGSLLAEHHHHHPTTSTGPRHGGNKHGGGGGDGDRTDNGGGSSSSSSFIRSGGAPATAVVQAAAPTPAQGGAGGRGGGREEYTTTTSSLIQGQ